VKRPVQLPLAHPSTHMMCESH